MNESIHHVFAAQLGLATRRQALAAGLTRRQIDRLLRAEWETALPGVYRHRAWPSTTAQRLMAALLHAGPTSAVSHRAAVALHGLRGYACDLVELTQVGRAPIRVIGAVGHRTGALSRGEVRQIGPLRVTTPARTLVDLGAVCRPFLVSRCLEEWLAHRTVSLPQVRRALDGRRGPGAAVLRQILAERVLGDLQPDSVDEGLLGAVLAGHGLPLPELHHLVVLDNGRVYELDWSYPELRVAFELDGYGVHLRSLDAFEGDRDRANELRIAGWRVLQFTRRVVRDRPQRVVSQVQRLIASI